MTLPTKAMRAAVLAKDWTEFRKLESAQRSLRVVVRAPLASRSQPIRAKKPMKAVNATRKAKKDAAYRAFMASAVWKRIRRERIALAGGRCEKMRRVAWTAGGQTSVDVFRCEATEKLTAHHNTYARFGGDELVSDLDVWCRDCHNLEHATTGVRPRGLR